MNQDPDEDWNSWSYEDTLWEYEFRNETFAKEYFQPGFSVSSGAEQFPYDTWMNDFYPIPGKH